ncbi:glycosyltransferase family 2 protein [Patescibacteria group bacterium]|nr:glycosyltransferase family 2 protein [Patescibacteria group bacterium]MBU1629915.1 glycosyltransferase family 2 protein [Patescibacteria group bacterium]MBU1908353.1 glycosyltransferase family 2 protein [Patescibacteria group bacterium]
MLEAKKLVINVVTWNSLAYMPDLLGSLGGQDAPFFTVTVVDNASDDGAPAWLQEHFPETVVLRNIRNLGFARAHNQAIELALSRWENKDLENRYIMLANPDMTFSPNAVRVLVAHMDANPDVAACGPKLLRAYTKNEGEHEETTTDFSDTLDSTGLCITKARRIYDRGAGEKDEGQYDGAIDVFGLSGACVMFRASALVAAKIGGEFFDEDFFAYKEDADLAWRLQRLGYKSHFVPQAVAWHFRRVPSNPGLGHFAAWKMRRSKSPFVNFLSTRNHGWMILKNDSAANLFLHLPWWKTYEIGKVIAACFSLSSLKGEFASLAGMPKMLRKRFAYSKRFTANSADLRKWFK